MRYDLYLYFVITFSTKLHNRVIIHRREIAVKEWTIFTRQNKTRYLGRYMYVNQYLLNKLH